MTRALLILSNENVRQKAAHWCRKLPQGTRVVFNAPKRTVQQSDRMWAMLTDMSRQLVWHGKKLTPDDWKLVMMDGLKRELRLVPNIDGTGFVNLGTSSSDLSKEEMSALIDLIAAFGAQHDVVFGDQGEEAA